MLFSPVFDSAFAGVIGLLVGSFLNVVIYRLPRAMERDWWKDTAGLLLDSAAWKRVFSSEPPPAIVAAGQQIESTVDSGPGFSIVRPRSRCPHCGHQLRWFENIPVLSYLALRGRCSACKAPISIRYPVIELLTGAVFALCAARWGLGTQAALWAAFGALVICLAFIDLDTQYLPDDLNYALLWLGIIAAAAGYGAISLKASVTGAVVGYLSLWAVARFFALVMRKEGMGHGDFKLLAALGAWFGPEYLLAIILMSSIVGAVGGGLLLITRRLDNKNIPFAYGPYLAGAGLVCFLLGDARVKDTFAFAFPF